MVQGRRPKAAQLTYNQGDAIFRFEILKRDIEMARASGLDDEALLVTLRETKLDGKQIAIALDEQELTVVIFKMFECLINLQARRQ